MKKIVFAVFYCLCHIAYGQFLFQIDKDTCIKWNYLEGDEFSNGHFREDLWINGFPWSRSLISEDIYYSEKNVLVDSGLAKFRVNREKTVTKLYDWEHDSASFKRENKFPEGDGRYELSYTGGLLWSKKKYQYGYFEARFKNPQSKGFWPAFWLYGEKANEIDFLELKGEKTSQLHVDIHCPEGCRNYIEGFFGYRKAFGHWVKTTGDFANEFNVISGEWQPGYVKYYLNGNLIAYFFGNIDVPLALTVGNGKAHEGGPFAPGVNEKTLFPSDFVVDYVRIWTKNDTKPDIKPILETDTQQSLEKGVSAKPKGKRLKFKRKIQGSILPQVTLSVLPTIQGGYMFCLMGPTDCLQDFNYCLISEQGNVIYKPTSYENGYSNFDTRQKDGQLFLRIQNNQRTYTYKIR